MAPARILRSSDEVPLVVPKSRFKTEGDWVVGWPVPGHKRTLQDQWLLYLFNSLCLLRDVNNLLGY